VPVGNNTIRNNLVYNCSDDGVDAWAQRGNLIEYNVAHHCGHGSGDGNGFKLGGNGIGGGNTVRFNVSYQNAMRGFVTNACAEPNVLYNNVAWGHDAHAGFTNSDGLPHVFRNNINSGAGGVAMTGSVTSNNSWNLGISDCRFASTDPTSSNFLHLSSTSPCIDAGTPVSGVSYLGSAPDLGAFELR
jgi:parallel beta-helix repeat protein